MILDRYIKTDLQIKNLHKFIVTHITVKQKYKFFSFPSRENLRISMDFCDKMEAIF